jgi:hypothetical protein
MRREKHSGNSDDGKDQVPFYVVIAVSFGTESYRIAGAEYHNTPEANEEQNDDQHRTVNVPADADNVGRLDEILLSHRSRAKAGMLRACDWRGRRLLGVDSLFYGGRAAFLHQSHESLLKEIKALIQKRKEYKAERCKR